MELVLLCAAGGAALTPLLVRVVEQAPLVRRPTPAEADVALPVGVGPGGGGEQAVPAAPGPPLPPAATPGRLSRPAAVALGLAAAGVAALLTWRLGAVPALPAYLLLGLSGVVLSAVDLRTSRLPDVVTLPNGAGLLVLLTTASAVTGDWGALGRALAGMAALFLFYLAQALAWPGSTGMGDVKLNALLGLALGWLGWGEVVLGAALGIGLGVGTGAAVAVVRRTGLATRFPFGPPLVAGALLAVVASDVAAVPGLPG